MLVVAVLIASAIIVGMDARKRDWSGNKFADSTIKWMIGTAGLWIVAVPAYLVMRERVPLKGQTAADAPPAPPAPPAPSASVPPPPRPPRR